MKTESKPSTRDREGTEKRILAAARLVLAEEGPSGFGVNAVARKAGCDKQLIYRYFGGITGLIDALGTDLADWWAEKLGPVTDGEQPPTYAALMQILAARVLATLRAEPLMQKIILWELSDGSAQVQQLSQSRSRAMMQWIRAARGDLTPPEGVDAPLVNAVLTAAISHLVLSAQTTGQYAGLPLQTDDDWKRVENGIALLLQNAYARQ